MTPPDPRAPGGPQPRREVPDHDELLLARLYRECKSQCVAFARRLLTASGRNRHLAAFDAEEFYDEAWTVYFNRREYLADREDHVPYLNALIRDRVTDQRRRSQAQKRTAPGAPADASLSAPGRGSRPSARVDRGNQHDRDEPAMGPATEIDSRLADRDHLRQLLAAVTNPADARAFLDHELRGLTYAEIGASAGITAEAARRRVLRAKAQARAAAGGERDERDERHDDHQSHHSHQRSQEAAGPPTTSGARHD
jgi:RNA polymerase sigma factor (sigma-70 family)